MATNLLIYSTATADALVAAMTVLKKNAENAASLELMNITAIATGDVDTLITDLVAATYDNIYISAPCEAASSSTAAGTINCTQQMALRAKLKVASQGTLSDEFTTADTFSATTIGATAAGWTASELIGEHVILTAHTGADQISEIKDNTTEVITIRGTFFAVPDATTDFKTITGMKLFLYGKTHTDSTLTKNAAQLAWNSLYPGIGYNVLASALGGNLAGYSIVSDTCSAIGATSLTDSDAPFVASALIGKYVQIYSATTNGYQYGLITANSTTVLTIAGGWNLGLTPTGTPAYKVVDSLPMVFRDLYVKYYVNTYMSDPTTSGCRAEFIRLVDVAGGNATAFATTGHVATPVGDWDYFAGSVLSKGKIIFDALVKGVSA